MIAQGWIDLGAIVAIAIVILLYALDGYQRKKSFLKRDEQLFRDQYERERRAQLDAMQHIPPRRETKRQP